MEEEEIYEYIASSKPHPYDISTNKYVYEGTGVTHTHVRTDRPACCAPVFKEEIVQVSCTRKRVRDTSKYSPQADKQLYRLK